MNFVEAAVLESTDGVRFKEVRVAPREEDLSSRRNMIGQTKSLYEQLMENKMKKEAEWKEQNNPFRPPAGLDEDDVEFLQQKEEMERQKEEALRRQEELERQLYQQEVLAARLTTVVSAPEEPPTLTERLPELTQPHAAATAPASASKPALKPVVVVKKKAKDKKEKDKGEKEKDKEKKRKAAEAAESAEATPSSKRAKPDDAAAPSSASSSAPAKTAAPATSAPAISSLVSYDDDDD